MESKFADESEAGPAYESKFADDYDAENQRESKQADEKESKFEEPDSAARSGEEETQVALTSSIFGNDLIVAKLIEFWGQALSDDIDTFFADYCTEFDDDSENKLVYTKIHNKYEHIMEKHLQNFRKQEGIAESEFYTRVRKATNQSELAQMIIELVLSCADFECFVDIMKSKRRHLEESRDRVEIVEESAAERSGVEAKC